tara:strand:+ start:107 stop:1057 length:951 start_codon:yes stop_codon:yes gene_type:complete
VKSNLNSFKCNVYSQFGEDGIVEEIFRRINLTLSVDNWCVEFGAWDGIKFSNTYNLIKNKNYRAVLIEADPLRFKALCKNIPSKEVHKICQIVTTDRDSSLDNILSRTPIPENFDFLSIDIDGCDIHIFESLIQYRPKLVCVEFNPTIPNEVEFIQPNDPKVKRSSSAKSLNQVAQKKQYSLVAATKANLFFVPIEIKNAVTGPEPILLGDVRDDARHRIFLFSGFDGTIFTSKTFIPPKHGIPFDFDSIQQIPKYLRKYPPDYGWVENKVFRLFRAYKLSRQQYSRLKRGLFGPNGLKWAVSRLRQIRSQGKGID